MNIKRALTWLSAIGGTISGATIDNSVIGGTTPAAGTFTSVTDSGLTSGRVVVAGTSGLLGDDSALAWTAADNLMMDGITPGTNAAKVIYRGSGTAPSAAHPADAAGIWVADIMSVAGDAGWHINDELGNIGAVGFKKNIVNTTAGNLDLTNNANKVADYIQEISSAGTVTLPPVTAALYGSRMIVMVTAAVAVSVDPNAADRIVLAGTALDDGDKITNDSTAGSFVELYCDGANGWRTLGMNVTWTDGG